MSTDTPADADTPVPSGRPSQGKAGILRAALRRTTRGLARGGDWKAQVERAAAGGIAAGAGWTAASVAGLEASAAVAAIAALLSVSVALHRSVITATRMVAGCAGGIALAGLVHAVTGSTAVAVAAGAGAGLLAGRTLRIGDDGALQVAITAIILAGIPLGGDSLAGRVAATALGALIGILVSATAHRSRIVRQAANGTSALEQQAAACLHRIGKGITAGYGTEQAADWLEQARTLVRESQAALTDTQDAVQHARYSPAASAQDVEPILQRAVAAQHTATQVNGIARAAFDATHAGVPIPAQVGALLRSVAKSIEDRDSTALRQAQQRHAQAAAQLARMDSLDEMITTGTILADTGRILEAVSGDSPALLLGQEPTGREMPPLLRVSLQRQERDEDLDFTSQLLRENAASRA